MSDGRLLFDEQAQATRRLTLFAAIAGFVALACMLLGIGQSLQLRFLDFWYLIRGDREASTQVVIVEIDGKSLNAEPERWPWPRDKYVRFIEKLQEAGANVIGFDITFSRETPEDDALAEAMRTSKNIVFGMAFNNAGDPSPPGVAPPDYIVNQAVPRFDVPFLNVIPAPGVEPPSPVLAEAAAAFGHVVMLPSSDGTLRQAPLLIRHGDRSYPSFSLQVARVYDLPLEEIEVTESHLRVGYNEIPILQNGETWINWTTTNLGAAFPRYSFVDVLRGDVGERELGGKAVLVGMAAEGLDDREFPFGWTLPGVVLHAAFLDNFFFLNFLRAPSWGIGLELGLVAALAVAGILLFPRLPTPWLLASAIVLLLSVLALSLYLFIINSIWWPPMYPALAVAFPFATTVFLKLRSTEKAKEAETAKVREAKTQIAEAVLEKGLAFQEKGSLDLAIATFSRLPMSEEMKTIYLNLGFDFQSRNRLDKALLCYKRVFDMDPNFGDVAQRIEALRQAGVGTQLGASSLIGGSSSVPYSPTPPRTPPPASIEETAVTGDYSAAASSPGDVESSFVPTLPGAGASAVAHSMPGVEPQPGNPGSRYRMIKALGKGAMGEVLLMQDTKLDRKVAIKMMRPDLEMSSQQAIELRHRFVREAKTAGKLTHPNIVTIFDSFEGEDGVAYIVMEFVDGDTLKNFTRSTQLTVPQIKHVIIEASKGLQHAHDNGVFHRDVKPDNIMITPKTGVIKVMDFGIARVVESSMTATGSILGTPAYMSPEQVSGKKVDARSDVFSLGVVLYELLVGKRPFDGAAPTDVMFSILQKTPPPPSTANPARKVSPEWDPIVEKALAKKAEARYQSAQEFAKAVRTVRG
ncbi:MAG TPA: CHASE2 domain-containing protein [Vicinamibacteria bacterium]|nr:CHASE2 domain-containing protein [Vicinamibacteria bacterium]